MAENIDWQAHGLEDVQVSALEGVALDWAMAKVEGLDVDVVMGGAYGLPDTRYALVRSLTRHGYAPASDLLECGRMMGKHGPGIRLELSFADPSASFGRGTLRIGYTAMTVPIAACRAIVAALLGDSVLVPKLLLSTPSGARPALAQH